MRGREPLSDAGSRRVRASLCMAAVVASKNNPDVKALYDRLCAQGKTKMSALDACMHACSSIFVMASSTPNAIACLQRLKILDIQDGIYIRRRSRWLYLARVLNLFERKVVGPANARSSPRVGAPGC